MTDDQMYKMLEDFINSHPLASEIEVKASSHHQSYQPRFEGAAAHYEDAKLLSSIFMGAECLLFWIRRSGYEIKKNNKKTGKKVL